MLIHIICRYFVFYIYLYLYLHLFCPHIKDLSHIKEVMWTINKDWHFNRGNKIMGLVDIDNGQ